MSLSRRASRRRDAILIAGFCALSVLPNLVGAATETVRPLSREINAAGFPLILHTPETGTGVGGGLTLTRRIAGRAATERPDTLSAFGLITFKGQSMLAVVPEWHAADQDLRLRLEAMFRYFPETYYGIGNDTDESAEEDITLRDYMLKPAVLWRLTPEAWLGLFVDVKRTDVVEHEAGGLLDASGTPGREGGWFVGAGPVFEWDTRDHAFSPRAGDWFQASLGLYREAWAGDYDFESLTLDWRRFYPVGAQSALALQVLGVAQSGEVPFSEMARMEQLRGILGTRFRDRRLLMSQIEFRFPIHGRVSGVAFGGIGDVFRTLSDIGFDTLKYGVGGGVRVALNRRERINLRLDVGLSPWESGVYLRMLEAF